MKFFWKGFRKGAGQGAVIGSLFIGVGFGVLLFQHRWLEAALLFTTGCVIAYLGMKIWIQEDDQ